MQVIQSGRYRPNVAYWGAGDEAINQAIQQIMVDGQPVQSTLDALHGQIQKAATDAGEDHPPSS